MKEYFYSGYVNTNDGAKVYFSGVTTAILGVDAFSEVVKLVTSDYDVDSKAMHIETMAKL